MGQKRIPYAGKPGARRQIIDGKLNCLDCGPRPLADFRVITRKNNGRKYFESRCDACRKVRYVARNFNISPEFYRALIEAAQGHCAICGKDGRRLVLDHCHKTGKLRGAVCQPCNIALSAVENNPDFVFRAIEYLQHWDQQQMTEQEQIEATERERCFQKIRQAVEVKKDRQNFDPLSRLDAVWVLKKWTLPRSVSKAA